MMKLDVAAVRERDAFLDRLADLEDDLFDAENRLDEVRGALNKLKSEYKDCFDTSTTIGRETVAAVKEAEYWAGPVITRDSLERWRLSVMGWSVLPKG